MGLNQGGQSHRGPPSTTRRQYVEVSLMGNGIRLTSNIFPVCSRVFFATVLCSNPICKLRGLAGEGVGGGGGTIWGPHRFVPLIWTSHHCTHFPIWTPLFDPRTTTGRALFANWVKEEGVHSPLWKFTMLSTTTLNVTFRANSLILLLLLSEELLSPHVTCM